MVVRKEVPFTSQSSGSSLAHFLKQRKKSYEAFHIRSNQFPQVDQHYLLQLSYLGCVCVHLCENLQHFEEVHSDYWIRWPFLSFNTYTFPRRTLPATSIPCTLGSSVGTACISPNLPKDVVQKLWNLHF